MTLFTLASSGLSIQKLLLQLKPLLLHFPIKFADWRTSLAIQVSMIFSLK
jgi:hypothetical protein